MAITKAKKNEIYEDLKDRFAGAGSIAFVNFHGLSVGDVQELRSALHANGVSYKVAKKTIIKKALDDAGFEGEVPTMDNELAVAWSDDILAPAREVYTFVKKFGDKLTLVGGVFEKKYKNKDEMVSIASIPSMQTLRGQFVMLINSPIQGFVMALSEIAKKKESSN